MAKRKSQQRGLKPAWKKGQSGNPKGRATAGATIREHLNAMVERGMTEKQVRKIARDPKQQVGRRMAAERLLRTIEFGDIADFAGLLRGENSMEDLRAMGINTEVVKKFKQKTRKELVGQGEDAKVEEVIEREIELHDRAGADFDRVVDHTDGRPTQRAKIEGDINLTHKRIILEDDGGGT